MVTACGPTSVHADEPFGPSAAVGVPGIAAEQAGKGAAVPPQPEQTKSAAKTAQSLFMARSVSGS
jgi:hypothetical protein